MINRYHPSDIDPTRNIGSTTAHEFVRVQLLFQHADGNVGKWRHSKPEDPMMKSIMKRAEREALK